MKKLIITTCVLLLSSNVFATADKNYGDCSTPCHAINGGEGVDVNAGSEDTKGNIGSPTIVIAKI